ncbi:odorant receptor 131-2-like [Rhinophrynus dorsalis]
MKISLYNLAVMSLERYISICYPLRHADLSLVSLVILYTYIKVMLVARNTDLGTLSASKAGRTVLLHAFQLLLSMGSLMSSFTVPYLNNYVPFISITTFFVFMCLLRLPNPLIYGMRDEVFSKYLRKMFSRKQ